MFKNIELKVIILKWTPFYNKHCNFEHINVCINQIRVLGIYTKSFKIYNKGHLKTHIYEVRKDGKSFNRLFALQDDRVVWE